eukprot:SAG31_NODE_8156_length_1507_cov_1.671165_2_plen_88_part_00
MPAGGARAKLIARSKIKKFVRTSSLSHFDINLPAVGIQRKIISNLNLEAGTLELQELAHILRTTTSARIHCNRIEVVMALVESQAIA